MRARNIKPGFFRNDEIAELKPEIRLLFIGLWCMADRAGFLKWRPKRIWADIFPYDQGFKGNLSPWLHELAEKDFITIYMDEAGNEQFLGVNNFTKHQRIHHNEKDSEIEPLISTCHHYVSKCPELLNDELGMRNDEDVQTSGDDSEPVMEIPLNKKGESFLIFDEDVNGWQETFPGVDVLSELRRCRQWNIDNPKRRKTRNGIRTHISSWLGRQQDRGKVQKKPTASEKRDALAGAYLDGAFDHGEAIAEGNGGLVAPVQGSGVPTKRIGLPDPRVPQRPDRNADKPTKI